MYYSESHWNYGNRHILDFSLRYNHPMAAINISHCMHAMQVSSQSEVLADPCKDANYKEAAVDTMRLQKDEVTLYINYQGGEGMQLHIV